MKYLAVLTSLLFAGQGFAQSSQSYFAYNSLGINRTGTVICATGNTVKTPVDTVQYFIESTQSYDAKRDESTLTLTYGTQLIKSIETLIDVKPVAMSKKVYRKQCPEYLSSISNGVFVSLTAQNKIAGRLPLLPNMTVDSAANLKDVIERLEYGFTGKLHFNSISISGGTNLRAQIFETMSNGNDRFNNLEQVADLLNAEKNNVQDLSKKYKFSTSPRR